jgi:PAS domain S-box-containing protein
MILKSRYEVLTASSGPEALKLIQQTAPDLVFVDIKMWEMDGIEVLKAIKQLDASIEVVMMTAYACLETAREAVAYHAAEYLIKPFSKAEVEKAVDKAFALRAERTGSRQAVGTLLEQMHALAEASTNNTSSQELGQSVAIALEQNRQVFQASAVLLHVMDAAGQAFICEVALGVSGAGQSRCEGAPWSALLRQVLRQRRPLRYSVAFAEGQPRELGPLLQKLGCSTVTCFPILAGDTALGVLSFLYEAAQEVRTDWQELGRTVAGLMALAIRAQQRYRVSQQEAAQQTQRVVQLSILREMSRVIMDNLDLYDMLHAIGEQLHTGLGYTGCSVWLQEDQALRFRQVYSRGRRYSGQPEITAGDIPCEPHVEYVADIQVVVAPVVLEAQTIGAIELVRDARQGPLAAFEVELIRMVLDYLGMAVRNSQLYGEIKATKSYLENLIKDAGDAIFTVNTADVITSWNASAERIFQYTPEEILQQKVWMLFPQQQYDQWRHMVLQEGRVQHLETCLSQRHGASVDVSLTVSPLHGSRDEIVGFSAIIKDVTQDKRLREQLLQSEKLCAMGEMAAGVAHNFNNILTTILGHTQLLLDYPQNDTALHAGLRTIETASRDAVQIVRRIRTFAQGSPALECLPTDLNQVVKEAIEATRPVWKEHAEQQGKCIEVAFESESLPLIRGQATELREVLTNLILNAVDAMPQGGALTLRTQQRGRFVCMTVSDTGTGMIADVQRRIFDPFFTTKRGRGSGLGLSVSHTLVRGHGGNIEVQSTPGKGTTFVVKLPVP